MSKVQKLRVAMLGTFTALVTTMGLTTSTQAAEVMPAAYSDCPSQHVCFWTGDNGTGSMCYWSGDDPDWRSGAITCSWSATRRAQSVYNNGTSGASVSYYTGANYSGRVGCTARGGYGNFEGNGGAGYYLRSHRWSC